MNLVQLEYLVATVKLGSFTRAGEAKFVTPQAISKAISDLENELEVKLLSKQGKSISPTSFGLIFSERADEVLSSAVDLRKFAKNHSEEGDIAGAYSIAVFTSPFRGNVIDRQGLELLQASFPNVKFCVIHNSNSSCITAVNEGIVDAAIVAGRISEESMECIKLFDFEPNVAFWKSNELADSKTLCLSDLNHRPLARPDDLKFCYGAITRHLEHYGVTPNYHDVQPSHADHELFFSERQGVAFVSSDPQLKDLYKDLVVKRLEGEEKISLPICVVYRREKSCATTKRVGAYLLKRRKSDLLLAFERLSA